MGLPQGSDDCAVLGVAQLWEGSRKSLQTQENPRTKRALEHEHSAMQHGERFEVRKGSRQPEQTKKDEVGGLF